MKNIAPEDYKKIVRYSHREHHEPRACMLQTKAPKSLSVMIAGHSGRFPIHDASVLTG